MFIGASFLGNGNFHFYCFALVLISNLPDLKGCFRQGISVGNRTEWSTIQEVMSIANCKKSWNYRFQGILSQQLKKGCQNVIKTN